MLSCASSIAVLKKVRLRNVTSGSFSYYGNLAGNAVHMTTALYWYYFLRDPPGSTLTSNRTPSSHKSEISALSSLSFSVLYCHVGANYDDGELQAVSHIMRGAVILQSTTLYEPTTGL